MLAAGSAAPLAFAQALAPSHVDQGLFQFEIYKLQPASGPTFLLQGPDGNLWFSNVGLNQIATFDIARQELRIFPLPQPNSRVLVMSGAPDGNVWYAVSSSGMIASITPAGGITEVVMPRRTGAAGLGPGPDGNPRILGAVLVRSPPGRMARYGLPNSRAIESDGLRLPGN